MSASLKPVRIGIIGGGFSSTAVVALLQRLARYPIEVIVCDQTGEFGVGEAYRTPYPHHLLNVRAKDMSAFENDPTHFVTWLTKSPYLSLLSSEMPVAEQFVPRLIYRHYLKALLTHTQKESQFLALKLITAKVLEVAVSASRIQLVLNTHETIHVDKVIFAAGNQPPTEPPFNLSATVKKIDAWDYQAIEAVPPKDAVLIAGTGLSMIDAVLTLSEKKHQGPIFAVSRHGLLPLSHTENQNPYPIDLAQLQGGLKNWFRFLRTTCQSHQIKGGDWREVINSFRHFFPQLWMKSTTKDKKQFLRHVLPYWNIHRHRVHAEIDERLQSLIIKQQLMIFAGRIQKICQQEVFIQLRHTNQILRKKINWFINCIGPKLSIDQEPLWQCLMKDQQAIPDELNLGVKVNSSCVIADVPQRFSNRVYALGPCVKGTFWECSAVPEIRKQSLVIVKSLLDLPD